MPDYGKRTGRDAYESVTRRIEALERDLRRGRGGGLSTFDRGDTLTQPAPVEGQVMVQYDTDEPWYYANGEWRDFCCDLGAVTGLAETILALPDLAAFWKLNEPAGATSAADSSGHGYTAGTVYGLPTFGSTVLPPGETTALFAGVLGANWDDLYAATVPLPTDDFTYFGWVKGQDNGYAFGSPGRCWLTIPSSRIPSLAIAGGGAVAFDTTVPSGTAFFAVMRRAAGTWSLWIDGVKATATSTTAPTVSATGFLMGNDGTALAFSRRWFDGNLSYVGVVGRALTDAEIADLQLAADPTVRAGRVWTLAPDGVTGSWEYPVTVWVNGA